MRGEGSSVSRFTILATSGMQMRVIVTGASRGIGAAIACKFAEKYGSAASIVLMGRSLSEPSHNTLTGTLMDTANAVEKLGARAIPIQVNLADGESVMNAFSQSRSMLGDNLNVLVNNASALDVGQVISIKRADLLYKVNARSTLLMNTLCNDALARERGTIVTLYPHPSTWQEDQHTRPTPENAVAMW